MAGMQARQSVPPGPPAPLDPNRVRAGTENAAAHELALQQEHIRLRPEERFRSQARPGSPVQTTIPPRPAPGTKGLGEHVQKLTMYPAWRYHAIKAPTGILVSDPDDEAKRAPESEGWAKHPPKGIVLAGTAEKLELLADLVETLAGEAEGAETPAQVLDRLIAERNDFGRKYTALSEARKGTK